MLYAVRDTLGFARPLRGLAGRAEDLGVTCAALERQLEAKQGSEQHRRWGIWVPESHFESILPVVHKSVIELQVSSAIQDALGSPTSSC